MIMSSSSIWVVVSPVNVDKDAIRKFNIMTKVIKLEPTKLNIINQYVYSTFTYPLIKLLLTLLEALNTLIR